MPLIGKMDRAMMRSQGMEKNQPVCWCSEARIKASRCVVMMTATRIVEKLWMFLAMFWLYFSAVAPGDGVVVVLVPSVALPTALPRRASATCKVWIPMATSSATSAMTRLTAAEWVRRIRVA